MENFTPYSALAGGVLIGVASALLLFFNGRIAGISGIMNGVLFGPNNDKIWRILFLLGLIAGGLLIQRFEPGFNTPRQGYPLGLLAVGGFLVGVGTRMANGCVSGHGVCGLACLSLRSLAATLTFIVTGMATVYILRHLVGLGA